MLSRFFPAQRRRGLARPREALLSINPVAVENLASEKSAKIKTRQEALQTIFFDDLDIFDPRISTCFRKKGVFQQLRLFPTVILLAAFVL
jgi:hypothetical protein